MAQVCIGSSVHVRDGQLEEHWRIVDPAEADASARRISADCPLARALLGHQAGEEVRVPAPERRSVVILDVR